jgi:hypothetical protein
MDKLPSASDQTILAVDIEGFGDHDRIDPRQVEMRDGIYCVVREALARSGMAWESCYHEDRGDGLFVLIAPDVPKKLLSRSVPRELAAAIREYNNTCRERSRIRLRMAVHAGQVQRDAHGVSGTAVNLTFRLLNSKVLRSALASSTGVLALIATDWFYEDVIFHDPASDAASYRRVRVRTKQVRKHAWICLPDNPYPARPAQPRGRRRATIVGLTLGAVLVAVAVAIRISQPDQGSPGGDIAAIPTTTRATTTTTIITTTTAPDLGVDPTNSHPPDADGGQIGDLPGYSSTWQFPKPDPGTTVPATTTKQTPLANQRGLLTEESVQEERPVELRAVAGYNSVEMDWWRQNHDRTGDLQMDTNGIFTIKGARLAVIEDAGWVSPEWAGTTDTALSCAPVPEWPISALVHLMLQRTNHTVLVEGLRSRSARSVSVRSVLVV